MGATVDEMKEIQGDIWDYHDKGHWIVITTNGTVRKDGACVMGRGVAKEAVDRFQGFNYKLGNYLKDWPEVDIGIFPEERLITFPTKHNWWEKADLTLIDKSASKLARVFGFAGIGGNVVYLVRPGCSNGRLDWKDVKPILEKYLDDRFIVVEKFVKP